MNIHSIVPFIGVKHFKSVKSNNMFFFCLAGIRMDPKWQSAMCATPCAGVDDVSEQRHQVHAAQAEPALPRLLRGSRVAASAAAACRSGSVPRTYVSI